jgi:hypothetical protein
MNFSFHFGWLFGYARLAHPRFEARFISFGIVADPNEG